MRDMPPTRGPWLQHPDYPCCLASVEDPTMSLLTVDEDGYAAFLSSDDCRKAAAAPELLDELRLAHEIICNALVVMTPEQQTAWSNLNEKAGLVTSGATRALARLTVLAKAMGAA
jgi:hypothetical protein